MQSGIKAGPLAVRTAGNLPAAGAYDGAGDPGISAVDVRGARWLEVHVTYTRGAAGGACKLKVLASLDGATYGERTILDGSSLSSGAVNTFTAEIKFPVAAGAPAEVRTYLIDVSTAAYVKLLFAEYGVAGTPGAVSAVACIAG